MKENKKVRKQKNTLSAKKATKKKRKHALDQESDQEKKRTNDNSQEKKKENTLSTKKATKKSESVFSLFFLTFLFSFKNSTSGLIMSKYIFAYFFNSHVECGLASNWDLLSN